MGIYGFHQTTIQGLLPRQIIPTKFSAKMVMVSSFQYRNFIVGVWIGEVNGCFIKRNNMKNELIGSLINLLVMLGISIYLALKAFGIIPTKDEKKREKQTSKKMKIISCCLCFITIVMIIYRVLSIN